MDKSTSSNNCENSGDFSDIDSMSSARRAAEALLMLKDANISQSLTNIVTKVPSVYEKYANQIEANYREYLDHLAFIDSELPAGGRNCVQNLLKMYVVWGKSLDKIVPDVEKRLRFMLATLRAVERMNIFCRKTGDGEYWHNPCSRNLDVIINEVENFQEVLDKQLKYKDSTSSPTEEITPPSPVVVDVPESEYDEDNEHMSQSSQDEENSSNNNQESMPLQEESAPKSTHEEFLDYLTSVMENNSAQETCVAFYKEMEKFLGWARVLEDDIELNNTERQLTEFRSKFHIFTKQAVDTLKSLCQRSEEYREKMLQIMLNGVDEYVIHFRAELMEQYNDIRYRVLSETDKS